MQVHQLQEDMPAVREHARRLPLLVGVCFSADFLLGLAHGVNYAVGRPFWKLTQFVDLESESGLATWYSSIKYFVIAFFAAVYAMQCRREGKRGSWTLLMWPLLFAAMSMDEIVQIHEWLGQRSDALLPEGERAGTMFSYTGLWVVLVGLPMLVFFFLWMGVTLKYATTPRAAAAKLITGIGILFLGALGFESLANVAAHPGSLGFGMAGLLEEGCEMAGATVILWGFWSLAAPLITFTRHNT